MSDKEKAAREWEQSFDVVDIDLRGELERAVLGYIFDWAGFEAVVLKAIEAVKTATYLGYVAGAEWATPKWIRCSERLPTKEEREYGEIEWWNDSEQCAYMGEFRHYDGKHIVVGAKDWHVNMPFYEFTHWRFVKGPEEDDLPEAPKEEE